MIRDDDFEPTGHSCIPDSSPDGRDSCLIFFDSRFPTEGMSAHGDYLPVKAVMLFLCFLLFCPDSLWYYN